MEGEVPMDETSSLQGRVFTFRSRGWTRFIPAAFLAIWLCAWAVGEALALNVLALGARACLRGDSPWPGHRVPEGPSLVPVCIFLLLWLTLWTLGGWAALRELLRLLWGEDRVTVGQGHLVSERRRGPFTSTRSFELAEVSGFRVRLGRSRALVMDHRSGSRELTRMGNPETLQEAAQRLRAVCREGGLQAVSETELPPDWLQEYTQDNGTVLVRHPRLRARSGRVVTALAVVALILEVPLALGAGHSMGLLSLSLLTGIAFLGFTAGAIWLRLGRMEWCLEPGRMLLFRRFGSRLEPRFEARGLALVEARDSDGDPSVELLGLREPGNWREADRRCRCLIHREFADLERAARLGRWLAKRCGLPLEDRTTPERQNQLTAESLADLNASGRLGRWLAEHLGARRKP